MNLDDARTVLEWLGADVCDESEQFRTSSSLLRVPQEDFGSGSKGGEGMTKSTAYSDFALEAMTENLPKDLGKWKLHHFVARDLKTTRDAARKALEVLRKYDSAYVFCPDCNRHRIEDVNHHPDCALAEAIRDLEAALGEVTS